LQILTNKISHILMSDKVSPQTKDAFANIIFTAGNEIGLGINHPELMPRALPLILQKLETEIGFQYSRAIYHSLEGLLDSGLVDEIAEELEQYEKRRSSSPETPSQETAEKPKKKSAKKPKTEEKQPLDLSEMSTDYLETNELANHLSVILNSPKIPDEVKRCIDDELSAFTPDGKLSEFTHSPEYLLEVLKNSEARNE